MEASTTAIYTANKIFTGNHWLNDAAIIIENGNITNILPIAEVTTKSAGHADMIAPAFLDIQIYGAEEKLLAEFTNADALHSLYQYCLAGGASHFQPTVATNSTEIFFKATSQRVAHPGQAMHLRSDSKWMVPEPELTLCINSRGEIIGYTVGNDLSCRDIEGENPLYLPQAKCFKLCAALGPAILIQTEAPAPKTRIHLQIDRAGAAAFEGETTVSQLKRTPVELAGFLFRDNTFPTGTFLMTGTGIVPGDEFTLQSGDIISITIDGIGTLVNPMA